MDISICSRLLCSHPGCRWRRCCSSRGIDVWTPHDSGIVRTPLPWLDTFVTVSQCIKDRFLEWAPLRAEMGRVVPDCIDHNACGPGLNWDDPLSRCGLYGRTVLLTLGRLACDEQYKGHDEILEVLPELAEEVPGVAYLVCGDGDDRSSLKRKAERLALSDRVVFAGYVPEDEKKEHCRLVDAFVMTGRGEGFGTVYLAAERGVPEGLAYFSEGRFRARWHRVVDEHLRGKVATAAAPTP